MKNIGTNVHATVIVAGVSGLAFVGPSGSGKSSLALACLAELKREGKYAALVADDQAYVARSHDSIIASCPATITGLMEIRHGGIVDIGAQRSTVLHYAVRVVSELAERLPPDDDYHDLAPGIRLPSIRLPHGCLSPLACIEALQKGRSRRNVL